MRTFTLDVTTTSVVDDDWSAHLTVLNTIPGSALLEDPDAPALIFDVDAENINKAMMFVSGIAQQFGFSVTSVSILDECECSDSGMAPALEEVEDWVEQSPAPKQNKDDPVSC